MSDSIKNRGKVIGGGESSQKRSPERVMGVTMSKELLRAMLGLPADFNVLWVGDDNRDGVGAMTAPYFNILIGSPRLLPVSPFECTPEVSLTLKREGNTVTCTGGYEHRLEVVNDTPV